MALRPENPPRGRRISSCISFCSDGPRSWALAASSCNIITPKRISSAKDLLKNSSKTHENTAFERVSASKPAEIWRFKGARPLA